jgi:hypothetical protein
MKRNSIFLEAINNFLQDLLKDATKALLAFLFTSVFSITSASIMLFLLRFLHRFEIPVTIPVSLLVLAVLVPVVTILGFQRLVKKRKSQKVMRVHLDGIQFVSRRQDNTVVPLCPNCRSEMLSIDNEEDNAARVIFGQRARYIYLCKCGKQIVSSIPPFELSGLFQEEV